ncbi:uncharacterized protein STEHIDRAFT_161971 [Stereum hirsutum FP-91666 SS1]|uniref:uncharacterized protein n=1 Tax=Stereum hirsutum (strain FP-91666) TaxID=721885 RepID=UPI000444A618|nr:uncharacterized protein STEHIDRAFT_161971 [Stereum hirsutum FP-91666 SS1]EIM80963.1 hypothetical protein STEHIDRAFT_161971 [Stereum hirsutum FP-91666 SS1]
MPDGKLLSIGCDMEIAQALGCGDAFLPLNDPAHSGVNTDDPKILIQYFIKICLTHFKRGIMSLRHNLSKEDYTYVSNLPSIETDDDFERYKLFCINHSSQKLRGMPIPSPYWFKHKTDNSWILPCAMRSRTKIALNAWDSTPNTTNGNESQHAWTNQQTGTGMSLLEAIMSAQKVDSQVAAELAAVRQHGGVFKNKHNEYSDRMGKRITRNQNTARKAMAAAGESREVAALTDQYEQAKASRRLESEREKALKAELDAKKGKASRTRIGSKHKTDNSWILPCAMRSRTKIALNAWDSTPNTTNGNESQHAWTNQQTGTGMSLLEAIMSAQKVDSQVAAELAAVRQHGGVFKNKHNEYSDRMGKRITRNQNTARKAMAAAGESREVAALTDQYEQAKASRRLESEREKALKAELDAKKGKASRTRVRRIEVTEGEASSSSGRAPKSQTSRGNARVHPYLSLEADATAVVAAPEANMHDSDSDMMMNQELYLPTQNDYDPPYDNMYDDMLVNPYATIPANRDPESMFEDETAELLRNRPAANIPAPAYENNGELFSFLANNPFAYELTPEGEFRFTGGEGEFRFTGGIQ